MSNSRKEPATCNWCRKSSNRYTSFGGILFCSRDCRNSWLAALTAEDSDA
jgi:hypothetical protein